MSETLLSSDLRATRVELTSQRRAFWTAAVVVCFAGSAFSLAVGLILSALTWTGLIPTSHLLAYSTIGLLFSAFILMFLGAHAMDRRDAAERTERLEQSRREGLNVTDYTKTW